MRLRILAKAELEIELARQYLNSRAAGLADRFLDDLGESLEAIAATPLSFPKLETLPDEYPFRRNLLKTFRYAIIFEIQSEEIVVIAVAHTSRSPNYWLGRPDSGT